MFSAVTKRDCDPLVHARVLDFSAGGVCLAARSSVLCSVWLLASVCRYTVIVLAQTVLAFCCCYSVVSDSFTFCASHQLLSLSGLAA